MTPDTTSQRMAVWLESAWLARYLDRRLSDEEAAWFEAYVLDKPELIEAIEADNAVRDTVALALSTAHAQRDPMPRSMERAAKDLQASSDRRPPRAAAFAVPLSLAAGLIVGFVGYRVLLPVPRGDEVIASPTHLVFNVMRGASSEVEVAHPDSASSYVLVDVAIPPGARDVSMKLPGKAAIPLPASADGFATFLIGRVALRSPAAAEITYELDGMPVTRSITFPRLERR